MIDGPGSRHAVVNAISPAVGEVFVRLHVLLSKEPLGPPPRFQPLPAPLQGLQREVRLAHVHRKVVVVIIIIIVVVVLVLVVIDHPADVVWFTSSPLLHFLVVTFFIVLVFFFFLHLLLLLLLLLRLLLRCASGPPVSPRQQAAVAPFVPSQAARRGVVLGVGGCQRTGQDRTGQDRTGQDRGWMLVSGWVRVGGLECVYKRGG